MSKTRYSSTLVNLEQPTKTLLAASTLSTTLSRMQDDVLFQISKKGVDLSSGIKNKYKKTYYEF